MGYSVLDNDMCHFVCPIVMLGEAGRWVRLPRGWVIT